MNVPLENLDRSRLLQLWDRSFLNYTPGAPDRWIDPEQEYDGFFDDPCIAVPILMKLDDRDRQQAYVEYFAAVWRQHFAGEYERLEAVLPLLEMATAQWLDRTGDLTALLQAVKCTLAAAPRTELGGSRQR